MDALKLLPQRPPEARLVSYDSATAELIAHSYVKPGRTTLYWLVGFIAVAVAYMSFVQIDRLVKTPGRLMPIHGAFTVQPLEKQIIRRVLVSVGDIVKKGQVLATCDPTFAGADLAALRQRVDTLDAELRRANAEAAGVPFAATAKNRYDAVQATLWERRHTEFVSGVSDFDQRLAGAASQIVQLKQDVANYKEQLKIAQHVEDMNTELQKKGYVSQLDWLNAQNTRLSTARNLHDSQSGLEAALHLRDALVEERKVFIDKWHEDVLKEIVDTKTQLEQSQQDLVKAQRVSDLVDLVAPEDAVVISTPKLNSGGVATDAQPLFGLVPINTPLEADVQIETKDIGFVHVGDKVSMKLDAFKFLEHGVVEGTLKTVGTDTLTVESGEDTANGGSISQLPRSPYYDARVTITALRLHNVPADFRLLPGMTLQADIVVGRRTLMWYLVGGALRSGAEAMHEP